MRKEPSTPRWIRPIHSMYSIQTSGPEWATGAGVHPQSGGWAPSGIPRTPWCPPDGVPAAPSGVVHRPANPSGRHPADQPRPTHAVDSARSREATAEGGPKCRWKVKRSVPHTLPFPLDLGPGQGETRRPLTVQEPMRLGRSTDASRAVGRPAGTNLRMSIVAAGPHPRHAPSAPAVMAAARAFDGVSRWVGWGSTEPTGWPPRGRTRAPRQRRGPSTRWAPSTASGLHSCPWSECGHTPIHPTQWTPLAHSARP